MPSVIAYHEVDDQQHWLASGNREKFFGPLGVTGIREFVDPENPSRVGVLMEIPDMDAVMAALQTEDAPTSWPPTACGRRPSSCSSRQADPARVADPAALDRSNDQTNSPGRPAMTLSARSTANGTT